MMQGLRAPSKDQTVLAVPGSDLFSSLVESNFHLLATTRSRPFLAGTSLGEVRDLCRRDILQRIGVAAASSVKAGPLIATGHQPEFCHPGVWAKNFLVHGLAKTSGGAAFNLVADADACHQTMVAFPQWTGSPKRLRRSWVRVGRAVSGAPWQLASGPVRAQEENFVARLKDLKDLLSWAPIGSELSPKAMSQIRNLGEWSGHWRQTAQTALGLELPDLTQSELCPAEGFGWFAGEIISRAGEFQSQHNQALEEFREQEGVKNPGQPVPPLEARGDWIELPFWIWRSDPFAGRKRAWLRERPNREISLGDPREGVTFSLEGVALSEIAKHLASQGLALRPRALTNTLFLRWFCCDWFVHGLGGAIYDRMTDRLGEAYYRHAPPHYGMVTATLRLPFSVGAAIDEVELAQNLRRQWWNPLLWDVSDPKQVQWVAEYENTRRTGPKKQTRAILWDLHRQWLACETTWDARMWQARKANQSRSLAMSREWPWIFHPRERLKQILQPLMDAKVS